MIHKDIIDLVELRGDVVAVYDPEFESSMSFDRSLEGLKGAYIESPEYFTDEVLISVYHCIMSSELLWAGYIISEIEEKITGRGPGDTTRYGLYLVDDGYEWIGFSFEKQAEIMSKNIRKLILSDEDIK